MAGIAGENRVGPLGVLVNVPCQASEKHLRATEALLRQVRCLMPPNSLLAGRDSDDDDEGARRAKLRALPSLHEDRRGA